MVNWKEIRRSVSEYIPFGALRVLDEKQDRGELSEKAFAFYIFGFISPEDASKIRKILKKKNVNVDSEPLPFFKRNPGTTQYEGAVSIAEKGKRDKSVGKNEEAIGIP